MIEIVCPSCRAHYQVPDDSIGPEGRKVTCSSCSHKWRAYPEAAGAEAGAAEAGATVAAMPEASAARPEETVGGTAEEPAASHSDAPAGEAPASPAEMPPGEPPRAGGREEQMDAIRRMLDDLKRNSEDQPEPAEEPAAARKTGRSEPSPRRYADDDDLEDAGADPLKSRIAQMDRSGKSGERPSNYDAAKLRRMHEKRARRLQKARERQRKSGAFLTGFTLVAVVTAAMVSLYVLHPQIIASQPRMEPAMNEYVVTVDRYRLALNDATAGWRDWVQANLGPLLGSADEAQGGGQTGAAQEGQPADTTAAQ